MAHSPIDWLAARKHRQNQSLSSRSYSPPRQGNEKNASYGSNSVTKVVSKESANDSSMHQHFLAKEGLKDILGSLRLMPGSANITSYSRDPDAQMTPANVNMSITSLQKDASKDDPGKDSKSREENEVENLVQSRIVLEKDVLLDRFITTILLQSP